MKSRDLSRIREIQDCVEKRGHAGHYFEGFDDSIQNDPIKRNYLAHYEADLDALDPVAWSQLRAKVASSFEKRDLRRGWQAAFNDLNEAKAYKYLANIGCIELEFIPRSRQKTPDIKGVLIGENVLCEVKTINASDAELSARQHMLAREICTNLPSTFLEKIVDTLYKANVQMDSYLGGGVARKFLYVIINFDDILHEYIYDHMKQIMEFFDGINLPQIDMVFDIKPQFYSANLQSPSSELFIRAMDGTWQHCRVANSATKFDDGGVEL